MPTPFEGWAILEILGHRQRPGFVTEVEMAGSKMLRVDMPVSTDTAGQDVTVTEYYSGAALYALRPCTEAVAREHMKYVSDPRPAAPLDFRPRLGSSVRSPGGPMEWDDRDIDEDDRS